MNVRFHHGAVYTDLLAVLHFFVQRLANKRLIDAF